jgi:hypothetical protein
MPQKPLGSSKGGKPGKAAKRGGGSKHNKLYEKTKKGAPLTYATRKRGMCSDEQYLLSCTYVRGRRSVLLSSPSG